MCGVRQPTSQSKWRICGYLYWLPTLRLSYLLASGTCLPRGTLFYNRVDVLSSTCFPLLYGMCLLRLFGLQVLPQLWSTSSCYQLGLIAKLDASIQLRSLPKILGGAKCFDFKQATAFGRWHRLSKHKMCYTFWGIIPLGPLGHVTIFTQHLVLLAEILSFRCLDGGFRLNSYPANMRRTVFGWLIHKAARCQLLLNWRQGWILEEANEVVVLW